MSLEKKYEKNIKTALKKLNEKDNKSIKSRVRKPNK